MGKKERTKGAVYENEVCKALSAFWPTTKRNLSQYQGSDGRDLDATEPLCFQLKRRKKTALSEIKIAYLEAAESLQDDYVIPAACWRDDNGKSMVILSLDDLVLLLCGIEDGTF
ncbi:hypothetical protein LCGC14_0344590 [marine sediment metagenome]|uniref:Uncharacterized protein n=1 Tax=marine sediment metagenome TaxID=412755 RepID=A0A0F9WKH0_9ZZZZ